MAHGVRRAQTWQNKSNGTWGMLKHQRPILSPRCPRDGTSRDQLACFLNSFVACLDSCPKHVSNVLESDYALEMRAELWLDNQRCCSQCSYAGLAPRYYASRGVDETDWVDSPLQAGSSEEGSGVALHAGGGPRARGSSPGLRMSTCALPPHAPGLPSKPDPLKRCERTMMAPIEHQHRASSPSELLYWQTCFACCWSLTSGCTVAAKTIASQNNQRVTTFMQSMFHRCVKRLCTIVRLVVGTVKVC